jgi:hypothetical protein
MLKRWPSAAKEQYENPSPPRTYFKLENFWKLAFNQTFVASFE